MIPTSIDLNCDLGEGCPLTRSHAADFLGEHRLWFSRRRSRDDDAALTAAIRHGVQIGAHPAFRIAKGFGRPRDAMTAEQKSMRIASTRSERFSVWRKRSAER